MTQRILGEWGGLAATLLCSVFGHSILFDSLGALAQTPRAAKPKILEFAVIETPLPPEPPPEPPKPRKPVDLTQLTSHKLSEPVTPPPNTDTVTEPEPAAPPPPPVFGVTMSSVAEGVGGFSVRVGNTLMKAPEPEFTAPDEVHPPAPVPVHLVHKLPSRIGDCVASYPEAARQERIEGQVILLVEVREDGSVGEVRVTVGLGHGLDEAAQEALRHCRFRPALLGDQPVATRIRYTYTFVLRS